MRLVAAFLLALFILTAHAMSVVIERGPEAQVEVIRDAHLYDIYVTAHSETSSYTPGEISIYLRREYPDYMHVALFTDQQPDGRLHARIAISPDKEAMYSVYVYDRRPRAGKQVLVFSRPLREIGSAQSKVQQ